MYIFRLYNDPVTKKYKHDLFFTVNYFYKLHDILAKFLLL